VKLITLSNPDVKNEWSYTSTPLVCLNGIAREFCTFILISEIVVPVRVIKSIVVCDCDTVWFGKAHFPGDLVNNKSVK